MNTNQVTVQLCDECFSHIGDWPVAIERRSHRWSFWCRHKIEEHPDWFPGRQPPQLIFIGEMSGVGA